MLNKITENETTICHNVKYRRTPATTARIQKHNTQCHNVSSGNKN